VHPLLFGVPELNLTLRSYQTFIALAVVVGILLGAYWARRLEALDARRVVPAMFVFALVIFAGARAHYVLNAWNRFANDPWSMVAFWSGGLHAPGGLIALVLAGPFVLRRFGLPGARVADVCAPTGGVVLAVVRMGCFLNGCCFGTPCVWPWCVAFPRTSYVFLLHADQRLVDGAAMQSAPIHPLQLYFFGTALAIIVISLWLHPRKRFDGEVALVAVVLFSATSAVLESFRADYDGRAYWGTLPQLAWTTLGMTVASAAVLAIAEYRHHARRGPRTPTARLSTTS
jgi:phosphatidylglycerol:prolipoprotein diacylglycerol transferase